MKRVRLFLKTIVILLSVSILLISCFQSNRKVHGNNPSDFVGTWVGNDTVMGIPIIFIFYNDGTVQSESVGIINRGTYIVKGNNIKIKMTEGFTGILFPNGQTINYQYKFIDQNRLELSFGVLITTKYELTRRVNISNGHSNTSSGTPTSIAQQSLNNFAVTTNNFLTLKEICERYLLKYVVNSGTLNTIINNLNITNYRVTSNDNVYTELHGGYYIDIRRIEWENYTLTVSSRDNGRNFGFSSIEIGLINNKYSDLFQFKYLNQYLKNNPFGNNYYHFDNIRQHLEKHDELNFELEINNRLYNVNLMFKNDILNSIILFPFYS